MTHNLQSFFDFQLEQWDEVRQRYRWLHDVQVKNLNCDSLQIQAQYNPARIGSSSAKIDAKSLAERPCFLCNENRPSVQIAQPIDDRFSLLVNPYPILPMHFTIVHNQHTPQSIWTNYDEIFTLLTAYPEITVFYNGPKCGASAPDHAHLQAGTSDILPLQKEWHRLSRDITPIQSIDKNNFIAHLDKYPCAAFAIISTNPKNGITLFHRLYKSFSCVEDEPMMNIVAWKDTNGHFISVVLPRAKHRPDCYYQDSGLMISPGALDMSGLIITPRKEDFDALTTEKALCILQECSLPKEDVDLVVREISEASPKPSPEGKGLKSLPFGGDLEEARPDDQTVTVGILSNEEIRFSLNGTFIAKGENISGDQKVVFSEGGIMWNGNLYCKLSFVPKSAKASFSLHDVTIGKNFHWERKETQTFTGTLHIVVESNKITAINELPVEDYLTSVISSEMNPSAPLEFLKASAVISRSWLLAQIYRQNDNDDDNSDTDADSDSDTDSDHQPSTVLRWYNREDHAIYNVCADDHCQRYQGITKANTQAAIQAINETRGQILVCNGEICDARFSKCCGGISEEYDTCWEGKDYPYLKAVQDTPNSLAIPDLTNETEAEKWIRNNPEAFCNAHNTDFDSDTGILSQVLNDFDQETTDFYRWKVEYSVQQISDLIRTNLKEDFGEITDLIPMARGKSGRIWKLKIVGTKKTLIIGKELEIRRVLSKTHLFSSAFVIDKTENGFLLTGAGWGHGVGMCQIGAAVMGAKGYKYDEILLHYYQDAKIIQVSQVLQTFETQGVK